MMRYLKLIAVLSVLTFIFQFMSISLIHNHDFDLDHHYDCPAFVLSTTFISFVFTILFIFDTKLPFSNFLRPFQSTPQNLSNIVSCINDRAPPF